MISLVLMTCIWGNSALWRSNDHREFYYSKKSQVSFISQEYRTIEDLGEESLAKAIIGIWPESKQGCALSVNGNTMYYEFSCKKLCKEMKLKCR